MGTRMTQGLLRLAICLLIHAGVQAQSSQVGNWMMYFGNQPLGRGWNLWNEAQYRNYNAIGDLEQLLLRTGIGKNLTEGNNNLLLGYAFILSEPYLPATGVKRTTSEHRIFQQFITRQSFQRVALQHRYRLEQRFLETGFRSRFRYFLGLNLPLNKSRMDAGAFYLSAYNEIFLHLDKPVFDRVRVYGAGGFVMRRELRLELGVMTQVQESKSRAQVQIAFFNALPFGRH
ncbi:MAG: DUF2490 domain-containing protein [Chitinophagia bacterium]|nr:DUF2490 domain-containing protein [Chitinophagia bacterium]